MVPLSKASVFSLQQILCGRAHSNLCWRRTTIFPGSSCARCPEFLCSHTGKAVPPHFHLRDRFDRWDHHYRGRQTNRRKSRSDRQARELLAPPRQLQGSIIDPNLLTEPEIRSPEPQGTRDALQGQWWAIQQHNAFCTPPCLQTCQTLLSHFSMSSRALLYPATPQREPLQSLSLPLQHLLHF